MAQFVVANNVNTQLATALPASGSGSTTVTLASSASLPTLNTAIGQMMPLTLNDAATGGIYETVYVTAISGATLTVLRGQEGTSVLNWGVGDYAFCGPTAGTAGLATMRTQYQASAAFSSSQTLTAAIAGESIGFTGTSASTFSMPAQSTVPALTLTAVYHDGTAALTLTANGSDKFVVATGQVTSIVMQPGDDLSFYASTTAGLWTAASGSALRQYEPLVVGTATAPQQAAQFSQTTGRLLNVQVWKTHGTFTYTKTPGTTAAYAECHGSGASGAGTPTTGASQCGVGGPGGSGAYASAWFSTGIPSGTTITIGQAGAPVNGSGNNGGSSSIGSLMTCPGGRTGTTAGPSAPPIVTGGGSGATGPATVTGGTAIVTNSGRSAGLSFANGLGTTAIGGSPGADGQWGGGGPVVSGNTPGNSATAPGAGGSGTATNASQASIAGGAGFDGFVSIYEYGTI